MRRKNGNDKRTIRRELMAVALSAVALAAASPSVAVAATDIFIKIGDIKGESTDDKHKDWIEVLSYSWGQSGPSRNAPKPQQPVGPPQAACTQEFKITKPVDQASPVLFARSATGTIIPSATLTLRKTDSTGLDYLVLTLSDVMISSVQEGGTTDDNRPTEAVSLTYGSVEVTYKPQSASGMQDSVTTSVPGSCR